MEKEKRGYGNDCIHVSLCHNIIIRIFSKISKRIILVKRQSIYYNKNKNHMIHYLSEIILTQTESKLQIFADCRK